MPEPAATQIKELEAQLAKNREVESSAAQLINGIKDRIQKAIDAALANGATAEELAPLSDEVALMESSRSALAAAVAENTPGESA